MKEVLAGIWHWKAYHEGIGEDVHSYYVESSGRAPMDASFVIDPRVPQEGMSWWEGHAPPKRAYLTNRHHYRHARRFGEAFGTEAWVQINGLFRFPSEWGVRGFADREALAGPLEARNIDVLCAEETAFFIPRDGGILVFGDALIRNEGGSLSFVPEELMGDDPEAVQRGLLGEFFRLMSLNFSHMLLAHGEPVIHGGKRALRGFLEEEAHRRGLDFADFLLSDGTYRDEDLAKLTSSDPARL